MVQFFALSLIRAINARLPVDTEVFLKPDVDAQNAVVFEHEHGFIYWQVGANLETCKIDVTEIHLEKNGDFGVEVLNSYDTINSVIETLLNQIHKLRG